jgi:uncharacterized membrane protein YeiH
MNPLQVLSALREIAQETRGAFTIPVYFDYVATFTWALSGAIVGARRQYDIVGVFVIAMVSSTGGGLIRDGLLLQRTPAVLTHGIYLLLIASATLLVAVNARWLRYLPKRFSVDRIVEWIDAVGVPAFAVVGMQLALAQGVAIPGVILVGVINGVGGGLLRDVIAGDTPSLLLPGQFVALVVLGACLVFVTLIVWRGWDATRAALATMAVFFVVRAITIRFNWKTGALMGAPLR